MESRLAVPILKSSFAHLSVCHGRDIIQSSPNARKAVMSFNGPVLDFDLQPDCKVSR